MWFTLFIWICMVVPAIAALNPGLAPRVDTETPADGVDRVTLPCVLKYADQPRVTWFVENRYGQRRLVGQQVVNSHC